MSSRNWRRNKGDEERKTGAENRTSLFSTLKKELIYLTKFDTKQQAAGEIFEFIEIFYNRKRLHSALGYLSPLEFVRKDSFGEIKSLIENKKEEILTNINQTVAYLAV